MVKRYLDETKSQAKKLWEAGASLKDIVQELEITRENTLYDWVKRYGWKRLSSLDPRKDELEIYKILAQRAKDFLFDQKFVSITEALKVYEKALIKIKVREKSTKKSKKKLEALFEDEKFDLDDEELHDE